MRRHLTFFLESKVARIFERQIYSKKFVLLRMRQPLQDIDMNVQRSDNDPDLSDISLALNAIDVMNREQIDITIENIVSVMVAQPNRRAGLPFLVLAYCILCDNGPFFEHMEAGLHDQLVDDLFQRFSELRL